MEQTVNGGKIAAALINAITFFVYTYVIIYTNCELSMHLKAVITAIVNFIGVYIFKLIEEKSRKDKLWKVECTVPQENAYYLAIELKNQVPFNYIENVGKYAIFNIYCATQEQSATVKLILNEYNAKYFVTETKNL